MHNQKAKKQSHVRFGDLLKLTVAEMQHAEIVVIKAAHVSLFEIELASWNSAETLERTVHCGNSIIP